MIGNSRVIEKDHTKGANVGGCITKPGEKKETAGTRGERKTSQHSSGVDNIPVNQKEISKHPKLPPENEDLFDRERALGDRRLRKRQDPYTFAFNVAHPVSSSSASRLSSSRPPSITGVFTKEVWAHKLSMWKIHVSEFKKNLGVQLKLLGPPNIEGFGQAGNFPDLIIRWPKAQGTGVVPFDMEELMSNVSEYLQVSKRNFDFIPEYAQEAKEKFPYLFAKAVEVLDDSWPSMKTLIDGLVASKVYMDEAASAFASEGILQGEEEKKHIVTKALYHSTTRSVALWAFDQLVKNGEVFIPCDQMGLSDLVGHFNIFHLKNDRDTKPGTVVIRRFETQFPPDQHFHPETINSLLLGRYKYHEGSPFSRLENYFSVEQLGAESARNFYDNNRTSCLFSCQETKGFFECLNDRESKSLMDDVERLAKIIYPQAFFKCDRSKDIRDKIVSSMNDIGEVRTPDQCIVKIQNINECEFYAIDSAMRFLINNEASYHLLKLYQIMASEELMRGVVSYSVDNSPSDAELEEHLEFINNNHREGLQRALEQQEKNG